MNIGVIVIQVVAKPKGVHSAGEKPRVNYKHSKLPPRFAKLKEGKSRMTPAGLMGSPEEVMPVSTFMPKIENWDNELANNIPPLMSQVINPDIKQHDMDMSKSKCPCFISDEELVLISITGNKCH
jgi:hypothetical protein